MTSEGDSVPEGLAPPIEEACGGDSVQLWSGQTQIKAGHGQYDGQAKLFLELLPRPSIDFEFEGEQAATLQELMEAFTGAGSTWLGPAELAAGTPIGPVTVSVHRREGSNLSGVVEGHEVPTDEVTSAKLLVINGPFVRGGPITRGNSSFAGRLQGEIADATVTVDQLHPNKPPRRQPHNFTHVAEIKFAKPQHAEVFQPIQTTLFRALSLMHGRWVGLFGPWLYSGNTLVQLCPCVTKTARNGGSITWYPNTVLGVFEELVSCLHDAYSDRDRGEAIQSGFHWSVEASLCAGGVEGSLILQQAALESLAWYEVVQKRKLCSSSGFQSLPAADKIRWYCSLYCIETAIPDHCAELIAYANAYNHVSDLVDVLVDVRNALVHGTPKKVERAMRRARGEEERSELWYQIGGLVDQALLAAIGYKGKMFRKDLAANIAIQAIRQVTWVPVANNEGAAID